LINTGTDILINRTFSREEEREADRLGLQYMIGAGFDPEGAVRSHQLLLSAQATAPIAFLSTHPPSEERIQNMRRDIATLRPANKAATQTASVVQMSPQAANASEATKMPVSAIDGGTSRVDKSEKAAALPKDDQSLPTVAAAAAASPSSQSKVSRAGIARLIITSEPLQGLSADVSINGKHLTSVGVDQPFRGTISAGKTIATVPGGRLEFVAEAGTEYRLEIALNPRQGGGFTLLGLVTAAALNQNTFSIYIKEMRVAEDLRPSATEKAAFQPAQPTAVVLSPVANQATNLEMQAAQRLVLAEPLNVSGWRQLGQQYVVMGDTNKALRAYQEAQRLAPSDPETLEELGILYAKNGEKEKTREVWEALNKVDKVRAERLFAAYILP
jgi:predicted Zn-dependent protease